LELPLKFLGVRSRLVTVSSAYVTGYFIPVFAEKFDSL